jgi:hypothetical protein
MEKVMNNRSTYTGRIALARRLGSILILLMCLAAAPAAANIDLELRPTTQTVFTWSGENVEIGLYAVSDDATIQELSALQAIIQWDPDYLQMIGNHGDGAVPLLGSGFPVPDPFNLNEADPPKDGDGMYVAFAPLNGTVEATPEGALITTFVFAPIVYNPATPVNILASAGSPPGDTIVFDGEIAGLDVTGTLSGCLVEILPCCLPDFDYNCIVNVVDFLILLGQWGTDPGGPPDINFDGTVNVNDFLLLLAAWGPCP